MKICPKCESHDVSNFCKDDGTKLVDLICICSGSILKFQKHCGHCGKELTDIIAGQLNAMKEGVHVRRI